MDNENKKPARNASSIAGAGGKNVIVETFANDMAEVLKNDRAGLVKKIIHGAEEEEEAKKNFSPESRQNKRFMVISIILLVLGFGLLAFFLSQREAKTVPVAEQFVPIVFNDKLSYLELAGFKKDEIEQSFLNTANKTAVKNRGVEGIYPLLNNQIVGMRQFFSMIKSSFLLPKEEELVSDRFLVGIVNVGSAAEGENSRPGFFILMKMRTTPDIFPAMRAWESKMFFDLHGFFGYELGSDTSYLLTKDFTDGLIENKNARILYEKETLPGQIGKIALMYVFADDNSVIITNSTQAVSELVLRLASRETRQ
jgi:hypothetical protein